MGIETAAEHEGSEMSFMAAIIAVEGALCPPRATAPAADCFSARARKSRSLHFGHVRRPQHPGQLDPSVVRKR